MKQSFLYNPDDEVIWENKKAKVLKVWFDGAENRYEIYISLASHRGNWIVRECNLKSTKTSKESA